MVSMPFLVDQDGIWMIHISMNQSYFFFDFYLVLLEHRKSALNAAIAKNRKKECMRYWVNREADFIPGN
jgi:hypothetical protein